MAWGSSYHGVELIPVGESKSADLKNENGEGRSAGGVLVSHIFVFDDIFKDILEEKGGKVDLLDFDFVFVVILILILVITLIE